MTRIAELVPPFHWAPVYWLALGTFAVGTEGFMIAAILPGIATDLAVSVQAVGQLMAIFALTYAVSSPVLTALTGSFDRRKLLILSMAAFAGANIIAAVAPGYWALVAARILLAVAAGLYVPSANPLAAVLAPPARRGRTLAIVGGGISLAVALGVPLGALIGARFGSRMTFMGVTGLAAVACCGLLVGMPRGIGAGHAMASLRERLAVVRQPGALGALLVTLLWAVGGYTVYTYIAPYLAAAAGIEGSHIGCALFLWGAAAFAGLLVGGAATDRVGWHRVIAVALPAMALSLVSLSATASFLTPAEALVPVMASLIVWGSTAWGLFPAQQSRLIGIIGLKGPPVTLSLNASFMYLGFSVGAALGSLTLITGNVADLGWVGSCVLAALGLFVGSARRLPVIA